MCFQSVWQCKHHTYHIRHEPCPLYASRLDGLEEIDHSLSFQSFQLSMDTDECTSTTNTITAWAAKSQSKIVSQQIIYTNRTISYNIYKLLLGIHLQNWYLQTLYMPKGKQEKRGTWQHNESRRYNENEGTVTLVPDVHLHVVPNHHERKPPERLISHT